MNVIQMKNRYRGDYLNKKIVQIYRENQEFDVDLIVAKNEIVSAHRVILSMYSPYLRRLLSQSIPVPKFIVFLKQFSNAVIQSAIELMYYGEIRVQTSKKGQMIKALDFLEIDYHKPSANKPEIKKSACESMEDQTMNTASQQQQPKPKEQHRMAKKPKIDHDAAKSNPKISNGVELVAMEKPVILNDICLVSNLNAQPKQTPVLADLTTESPNKKSLTQANPKPMEVTQNTDSNANKAAVDGLAEGAVETSNDAATIGENITAKLLKYNPDEAIKQLHDAANELMVDDTDEFMKQDDDDVTI